MLAPTSEARAELEITSPLLETTIPANSRGAGMPSNTDVAANTTAATTTSDVAERRMASAAVSLPNDGRCRCQFQAPNANTAATKTSFTISATPYGVDQRFDRT